jgi:hypothetical protein
MFNSDFSNDLKENTNLFAPSSLRLAIEANDYLDFLSEQKISNDDVILKLKDFKDKMLGLGFNSPFASLILKTKTEFLENKSQELIDLAKQNSILKYLASFKKFTLNRVAVAFASHKIKKYLDSLNLVNISYYLPLGGEYKRILTDTFAIEAYLYLQNIFRSRKEKIVSASKLISFDKNYKLFTRKPSLIKNFSTRVALFSAISIYSSKKAKEYVNENFSSPDVVKYNSILKSLGYVEDAVPTDFEKYIKLKEALEKENFFSSKTNKLDITLEAKLNKRRNLKKQKTIFYACSILFDLLFDYYLITPHSIRISSQPFYSVSPEPSLEQLDIFNQIIQPDYIIKNPVDFLAQKFELEKKAIGIDQKLLGPALLVVKHNISSEFLAKKYSLNKEELDNAADILNLFLNSPDSKLSRFIEGLSEKDVDLKRKKGRDL